MRLCGVHNQTLRSTDKAKDSIYQFGIIAHVSSTFAARLAPMTHNSMSETGYQGGTTG